MKDIKSILQTLEFKTIQQELQQASVEINILRRLVYLLIRQGNYPQELLSQFKSMQDDFINDHINNPRGNDPELNQMEARRFQEYVEFVAMAARRGDTTDDSSRGAF